MRLKISRMSMAVMTVIYASTFIKSVSAVELEEIIVTAEKRSANLQEIPIAISAFSQDQLNDDGITDLQSLQNSVPGLQFTTQTNFTAGVVVTLRGVGTDILTSGADQGVALHNDGVYLGKASAGLLSFYDLERVEVLRGPQGTLYGRNATGGSINIISAKPTEEFEAFGDVMYGDYEHYRVRGVVNGALADGVAGRLTATWEQRDGYIENLLPGGTDANDKDEWAVRGQLLFDLNDDVEVIARISASDVGGLGPGLKTRGYPSALMVGLVQPPPFAGSPFGVPNIQPGYATALPAPEDLHQVRKDGPQSFSQEALGANVTVSWDLENMSFKSITSWFENDTMLLIDGDGSELPLYTKGRTEEAEQFSQEFNLASNSDSDLEWLVGAFYYSDELRDRDTFVQFPPNANILGGTGYDFTFDSKIETTSWAVFGQASYYLSDKVKATLGLRYSDDKKEGETPFRNIADASNGLILVGFPQMGAYEESWTEPTGKVGLDYFINDDSMAYVSFSVGYKSGGLNINNPDDAVFDPEEIDAWEIGSKNRFWDNRAQLNLSIYHYDYTNLQLFSVTESDTVVDNAAASTIKGVDVEGKFAITDQLDLDISVAYIDSEFDNYLTADPIDPVPVIEDLSGNQLPRAPEWELNLNASYTWDVGNAGLTFSAGYHWQDDTFFRAQNDPDKVQEAYENVSARLTYLTNDDKWRISAFGENLTDEQAITSLFVEAGLFGSPITVTPNDPRTYGIEVGYRF